jgi:tetratricopeptide (TPR) repeat protein
MAEPLLIINTRDTTGRIVSGLAIVFALVFAWFAVRWQLGSMVAELTLPNDPNVRSASELARGFSSKDPLAAWLYANSNSDLFSSEHVDKSINAFEDVIRLSPNDYRWWIELGRIDEQADRMDRAEMAFRRATTLAPTYAYASWQLGNFLLRRGRADEAFTELRKTTENNLTYREQVFSLAWDYFDHDPSRVEALAADTPAVRTSLALFYAAHGQASDSLRIWNTLSDDQKAESPQIAKIIAQALTEKKFFRQGLEFSRQVGIDPDAQAEAITNGGFENALGTPDDNHYGWNVERGDNKLDIASDSSVKHHGNRSLRMNFRVYIKAELANPWQIVASEPGRSYTLHFWARSENLKSAGMPVVQIIDPAEYRLIAVSTAVATGTNDWQEMTIDFKSSADSDGFIVRVARAYCGDACPIVGLLWLDDFSLVKR